MRCLMKALTCRPPLLPDSAVRAPDEDLLVAGPHGARRGLGGEDATVVVAQPTVPSVVEPRQLPQRVVRTADVDVGDRAAARDRRRPAGEAARRRAERDPT